MKQKHTLRVTALLLALTLLCSLCGCGADTTGTIGGNGGWGDNGGGRESHTLEEINSGILGDQITFNTMSDYVIGDCKNFVGARENTGINAGKDNVWNANEITAEDGKEYLVRLYVCNDNPSSSAVSENTRVAFGIPTESGKRIAVTGFICSDNAVPSEYWDGVCFAAEKPFHLEYIFGSAILENRGIGAGGMGGVSLGDEIVTRVASENGVQIGVDALDGRIPGGSGTECYISIVVKAVFDS